MRDIAVVGCGLAGFHAARRLEQKVAGRRRVRLTIVDRNPVFVFRPAIAALATGRLHKHQVTAAIDNLFDDSTRVVVDAVRQIDAEEQHLLFEDHSLAYDYLVIAAGGHRNTAAFDGAGRLVGPDGLDDADAIAASLGELSSETDDPAQLAIVGGSATGVRLAAELATWSHERSGLTPPPQISIYDENSRLLADHSGPLADTVTGVLQQLDIAVYPEHRVVSVDGDELEFDSGERKAADLELHCAGRSGNSLMRYSGLPVDDSDRLEVTGDLGVADRPKIFAAGLAAKQLPGSPASSTPQLSVQQGRCAADNLLARMSGRATRPFNYQHGGDFIELGPRNAALELRGLILEGRPARWAYRVVHPAILPLELRKQRLLGKWTGEPPARLDAVTDE